MARIRTIKPEFWTDEKVVELSSFARLLFIGLWNFADDEGRLVYSPKRIKMQVLPADTLDISELFGEILRESLISIYVVDNVEYLQINNFDKHQKIDKRSASKLPSPKSPAEFPRIPTTEGKGKEGKGKDIPQSPDGDSTPAKILPEKSCTLAVWLERIRATGEKPISSYRPVWDYSQTVGIPDDWIQIAWLKFLDRYKTDEKGRRKRYKDWRGVFLRAIKENWFNIWYAKDGSYILTTIGYQADIETREAA